MSKYVVRDSFTVIQETYIFNARKEITHRPDVVASLVAMAVQEEAPEWVREIQYKPLPNGGHSVVGHFRKQNFSLEYLQNLAVRTLDEVFKVYSKIEDDFVNFERFRELEVIPPREVEA